MIPTPQQQAVLDAVAGDDRNLAVNAVAGSSKTTTAIWSSKRAGPNCGFVAFNKSIADEMRSRLNGNCQASTMHGLGFRLLQRAFDMAEEPDSRKCSRLFLEHFPTLHEEGKGRWKGRMFPRWGYSCVPEMVGICKRSQYQLPEHSSALIASCDAQDVELPESEADIATAIKAADVLLRITLDDTSCCDFDDMLAMPLHHGLVRPQFRTLFIDEAQDLNSCQHAFCLGLADRFVILGDPRQAIYGFCGADSSSFDTLRNELVLKSFQGCTELPLTWTFRCPTSHVALAVLLVPHIEARPNAPAGTVEDLDPIKASERLAVGDMVICRANAPLLSLAYRLIQLGKPVMVRGRALGDGLTSLVKKLGGNDLEDLKEKLESWEEKKLERLRRREANPSAIQQVRDRADCLRHLIASVQTRDELLARINMLFADADPANRICLSSIHRAKGLERERVFIWEPGLMPMSSDLQEQNLIYVALTRSKSELYLVDDKVHRKDSTRPWLEQIAAGATRRELVSR